MTMERSWSRVRGRHAVATAGLAVTIVTTLVVAATSGSFPLTLEQLWAVVTGAERGFASTVVLEWRLPRALAALMIGGCLGLSGALLQTVTRNPLASPDLIGISGGAFTAVLVTLMVTGAGWAVVGPAALAGGLLTAAAVFLVSGRVSQLGGGRFLLSGVAVASLLGGVNSWIIVSSSLESAMSAAAWGAGSLAAATWTSVTVAAVTLAVCACACGAVARRIRVHLLGDDLAAALGAAPRRLWVELIVVSVVLVAVATALCGPIGLLALVAPPIARAMIGSSAQPLAASAVVGGVLLAVSDLVAQHFLPGGPPAGLVTTVLGGGYLVAVLIRRG